MGSERLRKCINAKIGVFALAQDRQRVELAKLGVDEAGMTHDHAAVGEPIEKAGKQDREIDVVAEFIGASETRISFHSKRGGAPAEAPAHEIERETLAIAADLEKGRRTAGLAQPSARRVLLRDLEHGIADLRKQ